MQRRMRIGLLILLAFLIPVVTADAKSKTISKKKTPVTFGETCGDILSTLQSIDPVNASEMGIHDYDGKFPDCSPAGVKLTVSTLKRQLERLAKFKPEKLSAEELIDYKLINSNLLVAQLDWTQIGWYKRSPNWYVDQVARGLASLVPLDGELRPERLTAVISRMRGVATFLKQAQTNVSGSPQIWIEAARDALESAQVLYKDVAASLIKKYPKRANDILAASTSARDAMTDYLAVLAEMKPGDEKGFAIGAGNFNFLLANQYFLGYDADSLLKTGLKLLADADRAYKEYKGYVELNHQNGQDSVFIPACFSREDIFAYYAWEVDQVRKFIAANEIVSIPKDIAPLSVRETPEFLRSRSSGISYQPAGPFEQKQEGFFYIRPVPDSLDRGQLEARFRYVHRRGFRGSIVHEGFPGHHLQMQIAARNLNPVRKWQMNTLLVEGWALYSEEMMYKSGLYGSEDPVQWLGILDGIRFRAARIIADVKLHTGQFSYDACVDWMIGALDAETDAEVDYIRKEVRRYTYTPTIQMSYLIGKREILALKAATQKKDGKNFDEQAFHDAILREGSIPLTLLWQILSLPRQELATLN